TVGISVCRVAAFSLGAVAAGGRTEHQQAPRDRCPLDPHRSTLPILVGSGFGNWIAGSGFGDARLATTRLAQARVSAIAVDRARLGARVGVSAAVGACRAA